MNNQIEIPLKIKRWNWGAFLLSPFWCIRHGIWQGLTLFIPLFGLVVPFILGAKGSRKAWLKNRHEPVEEFLKRQKYWAFIGFAVWIVLAVLLGSLLYSLNYSEGMKMGLRIANSNKRLTEYFGHPIKKSSFFNGFYSHTINPKPSILKIGFNAVGSRNHGRVYLQWEKEDKDWVATKIAISDSQKMTHLVKHSPIIESSFSTKLPYEKNRLESAVNQMIKEKRGYVILSRSKENNDFIQAAAKVSEEGHVVFCIEYSNGYAVWNNDLYQSKKPIQNKENLIELFVLYAAGDDSHINLIEWNKLTSVNLFVYPGS